STGFDKPTDGLYIIPQNRPTDGLAKSVPASAEGVARWTQEVEAGRRRPERIGGGQERVAQRGRGNGSQGGTYEARRSRNDPVRCTAGSRTACARRRDE